METQLATGDTFTTDKFRGQFEEMAYGRRLASVRPVEQPILFGPSGSPADTFDQQKYEYDPKVMYLPVIDMNGEESVAFVPPEGLPHQLEHFPGIRLRGVTPSGAENVFVALKPYVFVHKRRAAH